MTFTGVAQYDEYTNQIGEDVRADVEMISPRQTRFLDDIGDGRNPISNVYYTWVEKKLIPDTFSTSSAIASSAAASGGLEFGSGASYLRVNDILKAQAAGDEMILVTSIGANAATIYVTRAYAGTSANSQAAGATFDFLGSAVEEGTDPRTQRRIGKSLVGNYAQKFREDISISPERNAAVQKAANQPEPYDEEMVDKLTEVMKQLEKSVLIGRTNGNTIGADDAAYTMAGIYNSITTNVVSHATYSNSILNNMLAEIDDYTDLAGNVANYSLYAGTTAFRKISNSRDSRIEEMPTDTAAGVKRVTTYMSDFGDMPIMNIRWLKPGSVLALRKDLIEVSNYTTLSFGHRRYDDGASALKGYIEGTYGLRFIQENAHGRLDGIA